MRRDMYICIIYENFNNIYIYENIKIVYNMRERYVTDK